MHRTSVLALLSTSLLLFSCSSGGDSGLGAGAAAGSDADFVLTSSGEASLSSLVVPVVGARLESGGELGESLLGAPRSLEVVAANGQAEWLVSAELSEGTYDALVVDVDASAARARDLAGEDLPVEVADASVRIELSPSLVVEDDGYHRFELQLDLDSGVRVESGIVFVDLGAGFELDENSGAEPLSLDEVLGVVSVISLPDRAVVLETFSDLSLDEPLGPVGVLLEGATLIGADGAPVATELDFFSRLQVGVTVLRVEGRLGALGELVADRAEIVDPSAPPVARIEGRIVALDADAEVFTLLIGEIESGEDLVLGVLADLGSPLIVDVAYGDATVFRDHDDDDDDDDGDDHGPAGPEDLAVGMFVEVEFAEFETEPFPAATIEIEDDCVSLSGRVVDVSGLPDSIEVELSDDLPDLAGVADRLTVPLEGVELTLDVHGDPELEPEQILAGVRVKLRGCLGGSLPAADFLAESITVRPGEFDKATVSDVFPDEDRFDTSTSRVKQPFSFQLDKHDEGPLEVLLAPGVVFTKDAHSAEQFYALYEDVADCPFVDEDDDGEDDGDHDEGFGNDGCGRVEVRVKGLGTDVPHRVTAYEVRVQHKKK